MTPDKETEIAVSVSEEPNEVQNGDPSDCTTQQESSHDQDHEKELSDEPPTTNIHCWNEWVPMSCDSAGDKDRRLYNGVQQLHLCTLQWIDETFAFHKIKYWICGGTLVGAIRHGGFIPHDDDVDIECFASDLDRIVEIPTNPPLYTGFVKQAGTWEGQPVAKLKFFHGQFEVDVFVRSADLIQEHSHFPTRDEVFPLKRFQFHNIKVWGPGGDPETYLDRCYGDGWRDTVKVWNHDFNWCHGSSFDSQKVVLSLGKYKAIVEHAGITPPTAESTAEASFEAFCNEHGDTFLETYEKYKFQRVLRRNRAQAEWREQTRQESAADDDDEIQV